MNLTSNFISRVFLILAFAGAILLSGTQTQAESRGRLIVQRAPNLGTQRGIRLSIDGRDVANILRNQRYDGYLSAGHHVLTALALPNTQIRRPTSIGLTIRSGHTYVFTAGWDADHLVLRRSTLSNATLETSTVGKHR